MILNRKLFLQFLRGWLVTAFFAMLCVYAILP
jgi:hypothetical protein